MLNVSARSEIYLVSGVTDMRQSFNGLLAIVQGQLKKDPLEGQIFAFCNRRRNRLKILHFDGSGLWVCAKRLERGTFSWPEGAMDAIELRADELQLILGGLDLSLTKRREWYRRPTVASS